MTKTLFATAAAVAFLLGGAAYAQQTSTSDATSQAANSNQNANVNGGSSANNGGVQVGPTTSNSNSGANSGSLSSANNGGQQTTVGAQTSTSNANAATESNSLSVSRGGNATGGTSTSTATGGVSGSNATGGSSSATANPNASNQGNAQNITFNSPPAPVHTVTEVKSAPTVYAPALATTLTETCMGSSSAAGSGMGWGLSFGTNWKDDECVRRLNAREVASLTGDREAARAILCKDKDVYDAFMEVGRPCPGAPGYVEQSPASYVPPPPAPPPAEYLYAAPPPPPPQEPPATAQHAAPGTMAPIPNPPEGAKEPRG